MSLTKTLSVFFVSAATFSSAMAQQAGDIAIRVQNKNDVEISVKSGDLIKGGCENTNSRSTRMGQTGVAGKKCVIFVPVEVKASTAKIEGVVRLDVGFIAQPVFERVQQDMLKVAETVVSNMVSEAMVTSSGIFASVNKDGIIDIHPTNSLMSSAFNFSNARFTAELLKNDGQNLHAFLTTAGREMQDLRNERSKASQAIINGASRATKQTVDTTTAAYQASRDFVVATWARIPKGIKVDVELTY